jgi:hypothetical protein
MMVLLGTMIDAGFTFHEKLVIFCVTVRDTVAGDEPTWL